MTSAILERHPKMNPGYYYLLLSVLSLTTLTPLLQDIKMLTKEDVSTTDGGWWMLPSIAAKEGDEDSAFLKEKFDSHSYNTRHIPWDHVTVCPHCEKECKDGLFSIQIMLKQKVRSITTLCVDLYVLLIMFLLPNREQTLRWFI